MVENAERVYILSSHDISTAQGTTEPYYVSKRLGLEYNVHVFAPVSGQIDNAQTHFLKIDGLAGTLLINLMLLPYWFWLCIFKPPDTVYSYRNIIFPAIIFKYICQSEVIYDIRADPYQQPKEMAPDSPLYRVFLWWSKRLHSIAFGYADTIVTLSKPLCTQLCRNFGVAESKIHIVPLGVDASMFRPTPKRSDKFCVVYIGSMNEHRRLDIVISALATLSSTTDIPVQLDVFGSADEKYTSVLTEQANKQNVELNQHGFVNHKELPKLAGQADVAVSPLSGTTSFEVSSPAKIYEYLAMGLPVVATRITPHERILTDGRDSVLVPPDSVDGFADAFRRLATDQSLRDRYSEAAREKGEENSWDSRLDTITAIIEDTQ